MYQDWIKDYERLKRKKCKCCEAIKELQEIENAQEKIQDVKHILKARLTSITRKKGIKKEIGVINFDYYDLNYCPKCGRKLLKEGD